MLLLSLVPSCQAPGHRAPAVPQALVRVDGRDFRIPRLPESQNEAMRQWPGVKRITDTEVASLSDSLDAALDGLPEDSGPGLPAESAAIARLDTMLRDTRFKALMGDVVAARLEWLRCMEAAPAEAGESRPAGPKRGDPMTVSQVARRLMDAGSVDRLSPEFSLAEEMLRTETRTTVEVPESMAEAFAEDSARGLLREARMQVMHREGQRMAKPWNKLVDYLQVSMAEAAPLAAEPEGAESPRHRRLRKLVEAQMIARGRAAAWMAAVMWSDLALSPEGPAPLRPLRLSRR